ncbi:phosphoribosylamine--glycine ligase [Sphingobacteriales bacterium UPWRP_1]|nr:phosphoribosylamine--glycine ligase [Sphingobacteriales bacterium TSM_CSS]PSJ74105.1 phosphoribosylamine--glycine ligase [Sphingobacteriales bacterium UPWRP_1]
MKIAILGSGGREHALAWKFAQSVPEKNVYVIPGNGGTGNNAPIDSTDFDAIKAFCRYEGIELIFVGPELPLVKGITDYFEGSGIKVFGPSKRAARLEGSKITAKKFMKHYGVSTGNFWLFNSLAQAYKLIEDLNGNLVIKYDGLAGGKGVYVCSSVEEAKEALEELNTEYRYSESEEFLDFLIEEKLIGYEISIIGFTDGRHIQLLHPSQDHKQLLNNDKGPNTGGMGAYCPLPFYTPHLHAQIMEQVVNPTLKGLQAEKVSYQGVIYFGLMITNEGPKLLEYNVRFGDPETEVLLPSLQSDLLQLVLACFDGTLPAHTPQFNPGFYIDVVLAAKGYPKVYEKNNPIQGISDAQDSALVFHAGTKKTDDGTLLTNGGRVLNVVGNGSTLHQAIENAYAACSKIYFKDCYYRTDIGKRSLP